jgi:hypothetical protein
MNTPQTRGSRHRYHEGVFYVVLVEGREDADAFVQAFFTWAPDVGEAIAKVTAAAKEREGIANPVATELDDYDFATLPDDVVEISGTTVLSSGARNYFPADEPYFRLPAGVILSCLDGEYDPEELHPGFHIMEEGDLLRLECAVPGEELAKTFNALVGVLPDILVTWVECSNEWGNATTNQFYSNETLYSPDSIQAFLDSETENILHNGMVKFTAYTEEGQTNLLIDGHKLISVLTYSREIAETMAAKLQDLGFGKFDALHTVARGLHHWHYAPATALPRRDFVKHLLEQGFSLWKEIRHSAGSPD